MYFQQKLKVYGTLIHSHHEAFDSRNMFDFRVIIIYSIHLIIYYFAITLVNNNTHTGLSTSIPVTESSSSLTIQSPSSISSFILSEFSSKYFFMVN